MNGPHLEQIRVLRYKKGVPVSDWEAIVPEHLLEIFLNGESISRIACLGVHIEELALGFLHSEGYIETSKDIKNVISDPSLLQVFVETNRKVTFPKGKVVASSGARLRSEELEGEKRLAGDHLWELFPPERIFSLMDEMVERACIHQVTRGTHSAALADRSGILCLREDIGRHNCLDMLNGYCLLGNIGAADKCVLRTGRVSSEIVKKVARMGAPMVVSLSVPTLMAVELARRWGIWLVGRVRDGEMVIYTREENQEGG